MRKIIAKIGLTRGQVGFYDPLTNIHLTITKPFADVYQGMNTSRIKASIKSGSLKLVSGCLDPIELKEDNTTQPKATTNKKVETKQKVKEAKEEVVVAKEEIKQEVKQEIKQEVIEETPVTTEVKEEVVEEIKQEVKEETEVKPKTEKKSKKKSKKTEEVKNEDNIDIKGEDK